MPAPLGTTPTKRMPNIQVFGFEDSQATRGALRFFRERRIVVHFVDLRKKPIAPGELRRFVERLGAAHVVDRESRAWREGGLAYLATDAAGLTARMLADPRLIRLPLCRHEQEVTAGKDEATWARWAKGG